MGSRWQSLYYKEMDRAAAATQMANDALRQRDQWLRVLQRMVAANPSLGPQAIDAVTHVLGVSFADRMAAGDLYGSTPPAQPSGAKEEG